MSKRGLSGNLVPNYCASTNPDHPNTEVFLELIQQVACMYENVAVQQNRVDAPGYYNDTTSIEEIETLEKYNAELQAELDRLRCELDRLVPLLEEEAERHRHFENVANDLKQEVDVIDKELCFVTAEREGLRAELEDLKNQLADLEGENDHLKEELDDLMMAHSCPSGNPCLQADLQEALARSCSTIDQLSERIPDLSAELNKALRERDELQRELEALALKMESLRQKCAAEKALRDEKICLLQNQVKCLEDRQLQSCKNFEKTLKSHHDALDGLEKQKHALSKKLEDEKKKKEDLEKKLKDCEKEKKSGGGPGNPGGAGGVGGGAGGRINPYGGGGGGYQPAECGQYINNYGGGHAGGGWSGGGAQGKECGGGGSPSTAIEQIDWGGGGTGVRNQKKDWGGGGTGVVELYDSSENHDNSEREKLNWDFENLRQERMRFEKEKAKQLEVLKQIKSKREEIENREREIDAKISRVKEEINNNSKMEEYKSNYEAQLAELKAQYEAQLETNKELADINEQLGRQCKERETLNTIRESNEEILRKELHAVITASKSDIERLRKIIHERDEEVQSLRSAINQLTAKCANANQRNEELVKKVSILASTSSESLFVDHNDNAN